MIFLFEVTAKASCLIVSNEKYQRPDWFIESNFKHIKFTYSYIRSKALYIYTCIYIYLYYIHIYIYIYIYIYIFIYGERNGNPLQCSCLENPRDGGASWASIYGVAQSRTRLKRLGSSSIYVYIIYM